MIKQLISETILGLALFLSACAPLAIQNPTAIDPSTVTPTEEITTTPEVFNPLPDDVRAAEKAREALQAKLGLDITQVLVVDQVAQNWPDACLEVPAEGEICAMFVTPGYRIILEANGQQFELHSNKDGTDLRFSNNYDFQS